MIHADTHNNVPTKHHSQDNISLKVLVGNGFFFNFLVPIKKYSYIISAKYNY